MEKGVSIKKIKTEAEEMYKYYKELEEIEWSNLKYCEKKGDKEGIEYHNFNLRHIYGEIRGLDALYTRLLGHSLYVVDKNGYHLYSEVYE